INSAELRIGNVATQPEETPIPTNAILRILDDNNRLRQTRTAADTTLLTDYNRTLSTAFVVLDDFQQGDQVILSYNKEEKTYNAFMTLLVQELYKRRASAGTLQTSLVIFPVTPPAGKSANRGCFPADNT